MLPARWLSLYTVSVAILVQGLMHSLVSAYVFAIRKTQKVNGWSDGTGFGALLLFCGFYMATAFLVPRWPPKTCLRMGAYVFLVFAAFSLIPVDATIFVISFAMLGFVSMAEGVLLSWWGKKQHDRTPVVVARMSMVSVAANVPLAIYGALLNEHGVDFQLAFAVTGLITGVLIVLLLQRCTASRLCHQEIVDSTVIVSEYVSNPLASYNAYDSDEDVFVTLPRQQKHSVELSEIRNGSKIVRPQPRYPPTALEANERRDLELQLDAIEAKSDDEEIDVPSQVGSSSSTASSSSSSGSALPVNRPTFAPPTEQHTAQLRLWLGLWTWVVTFTTEALLYYNVAGFSSAYDTPWFVIFVVISLYTALILGSLMAFTRVGNSLRKIRYLWWYRWTWYLLLLSALIHALLMTTSFGEDYAWHSALSVMYMLPLTIVSTMPMSRAQELCQRENYTLHALLPMWTFSVASARAAAYLVEYLVLYFDRQLSMMFFLAGINAWVYFKLRGHAFQLATATAAAATATTANENLSAEDVDDVSTARAAEAASVSV